MAFQDDCSFTLGGSYRGDGVACADVVCGALEGCCRPDGSCSNESGFTCDALGGTLQGTNTVCSSVGASCPRPPEACCFENGTCVDAEPRDCEVFLGGTAMGPGTSCATTYCPRPPEACCFDQGTCNDLEPRDCELAGGTPQGVGSTCATADCSNDTCINAEVLGLGDTPFNSFGASTDGLADCEGAIFVKDIWFTYTATADGMLRASTCEDFGALLNTILAAYTGECGSLANIACNDSACVNSLSIITFPVTQGETYTIRLGGYDGSFLGDEGTGTLRLSLETCPGDFSGVGSVPDGNVGIQEFLAVLAQWGCAGACTADVAGPGGTPPDGTVGIDDFLFVLANWGPCI
jgi:hypothetical protein